MIDVHTHLDDAQFDADRAELIQQIKEAGIARLINSGSSHASCRRALKLSKEHDFIYCSIGIYPHDTMELEQNGTAELERYRMLYGACIDGVLLLFMAELLHRLNILSAEDMENG